MSSPFSILTCNDLILSYHRLVKGQSNVIIRNLAIKEVLAANGDALGIRKLS